MATAHDHRDEAFDSIEASILPHLSASLDALIETASLARPGIDAETLAERLRAIARDLSAVSAEIETLSPPAAAEGRYRAA